MVKDLKAVVKQSGQGNPVGGVNVTIHEGEVGLSPVALSSSRPISVPVRVPGFRLNAFPF